MKKFKSILALTASVLALSAFAAPLSAFAAGGATINTNNGINTSTVEDTVTGGFIVTIPADVNFASTTTNATANPLKADNGTTDGDVTRPIILDNGHTLKVYVKSTNGCQLKQEGNTVDAIGYTIATANGSNGATGAGTLTGETANITGDTDEKGVLLATFENKRYDTVNLTFAEVGSKNVAAGTYRDTLTFTIVDAAPTGD